MIALDDAETATYTHTLTVTGRLGGDYQCTVSNDKPSTTTMSLTVQGTLIPPWKYFNINFFNCMQ